MRAKLIVALVASVGFIGLTVGVLRWRARSGPAEAVEAAIVADGATAIFHERSGNSARGSTVDRLVAVDVRTGDVRTVSEQKGTLVGGGGNAFVFDETSIVRIAPDSLAAARVTSVSGKDLCLDAAAQSIRFADSQGRYFAFDLRSGDVAPSTTSACAPGSGAGTSSSAMTRSRTKVEVVPIWGSNRSTVKLGARALAAELESPQLLVRGTEAFAPADEDVLVLHRRAGANVLSRISSSAAKVVWEAPAPFASISFGSLAKDAIVLVGGGHACAFDAATGRVLFQRGP